MVQKKNIQDAYAKSAAYTLWNDVRGKRGALFVDLDDSFYHPNIPAVSKEVYEQCIQRGWPVIVVTGNAFEGVLPRIISKQIPQPHLVVGSVGTEIWVLPESLSSDTYVPDFVFQKHIVGMNFDRHDIAQKSEVLIRSFRDQYPLIALDYQHPERERQFLYNGQESPEPYKLSFYFFAQSLAEIDMVKHTFTSLFPKSVVLISDHTTYNRNNPDGKHKAYCLDILPIGKAGAVNYLVDLFRIEDGIIAGDSGNDVDMLLNTYSSLVSLLVAGAKEEAVAAWPRGGKRIGEWYASVIPKGDQKKIVCKDTSSTRLGPESIIALLNDLQTINTHL